MTQGQGGAVFPVLVIGLLCTGLTWYMLFLLSIAFTWPFVVILLWFTLVTLALLLWQEHALGADLRPFMRRFIAGLTIKLMGSVVLMVILVKTTPAELTTPLVVTFACLYVMFTTFSVSRLMSSVRTPRPER